MRKKQKWVKQVWTTTLKAPLAASVLGLVEYSLMQKIFQTIEKGFVFKVDALHCMSSRVQLQIVWYVNRHMLSHRCSNFPSVLVCLLYAVNNRIALCSSGLHGQTWCSGYGGSCPWPKSDSTHGFHLHGGELFSFSVRSERSKQRGCVVLFSLLFIYLWCLCASPVYDEVLIL